MEIIETEKKAEESENKEETKVVNKDLSLHP